MWLGIGRPRGGHLRRVSKLLTEPLADALLNALGFVAFQNRSSVRREEGLPAPFLHRRGGKTLLQDYKNGAGRD